MKAKLTLVALSAALTACGGADAPVDPYADLAEDTLLVRFEANPDVTEGQCNPKVHYALRTTEETILLNVNYEVVDQNLNGSGLAIFDEDQSGIARNTADFTMFDPYDTPCSELNIRVSDLTCRTEDEAEAAPCPSPKFEGTQMFASFRGLPNS